LDSGDAQVNANVGSVIKNVQIGLYFCVRVCDWLFPEEPGLDRPLINRKVMNITILDSWWVFLLTRICRCKKKFWFKIKAPQ